MRRAFEEKVEQQKSNKKSRFDDFVAVNYKPKLVGEELTDQKKKIQKIQTEIDLKKLEVGKHLALTQRAKRKLQTRADNHNMRLTLPIGNDLNRYRQKLEQDEESIDMVMQKLQKLRSSMHAHQQEEKFSIASNIAASTFANVDESLQQQKQIRLEHTQSDEYKEMAWKAQLLEEELESRRHGGVGVIRAYQKKLNMLGAIAGKENDEDISDILLHLFPMVKCSNQKAHLATVGSEAFLSGQKESVAKKLDYIVHTLADVPEQQLLQGASQIRSKFGDITDRHRVRVSQLSGSSTTSSQAHSWNRAPIQAGGAVDALARRQDFINIHHTAADYLDDLSSQTTNELAQILHNSLLQWSCAKKQLENMERELGQHEKMVRVLSSLDAEQELQGPYEDPDAAGVFLFL